MVKKAEPAGKAPRQVISTLSNKKEPWWFYWWLAACENSEVL